MKGLKGTQGESLEMVAAVVTDSSHYDSTLAVRFEWKKLMAKIGKAI